MDCFPMLYFLSVSEGILVSTVQFSPAWYHSCIAHEFIYDSWNRPEMLRVASLVCLTNQRAVSRDLLFTYLNLKYTPCDSPPTHIPAATSLFLSVQPAFPLLILSGFLRLKASGMRKSFFCRG